MASFAPASVPHQAIYRRWRAQRFSEIVGQNAVVETLRQAVRLERVAHGLLFVGPRGTGKTSTARIVAKAINCTDLRDGDPCDACAACVSIREGRALDVVELDAASNNRVDDMRELLPRVYTAAADLRRKVFIIDEVQRIKDGWDVLLKTLEEPPDNVVFIFCTTNPGGIRPAVVSRLQRYTFRPLTVDEIAGKLDRILAADGVPADRDAIALVSTLAAGGMRDAESMLDQLLASGTERLTSSGVRDLLGLADEASVESFVVALASGDALRGLSVLDALEREGRDFVAFGDQVVARLRTALVTRLSAPRALSAGVDALSPASLAGAARRLASLDTNRVGAGGYRFQLELALLEAAAASSGDASIAEDAPAAELPAPGPDARRAADGRRAVDPQHPTAIPVAPAASAPADSAPVVQDAPAVPARPTSEAARAQPATDAAVAALERLRRGWPEVVAHVGRNPANRPLIAACRPVEVEGTIAVLGFPEDQAFLRDIAERKQSVLEEGVQAVLGAHYAVRCIATNLEAVVAAEHEDALDMVEPARRIFAGDLIDVAEIR